MKKTNFKMGFTLIELLVVITIIGILATGVSTVYISAQQKARDSVRQQDILALRSAIEQAYGDDGAYLTTGDFEDMDIDGDSTGDGPGLVAKNYLVSLPNDPKTGNADAETQFAYTYGAAMDDGTSVPGQLFEVSANFENTGNQDKEADDGGDDDTRWEAGVKTDVVDTSVTADGTVGSNEYSSGVNEDAIIIDEIGA